MNDIVKFDSASLEIFKQPGGVPLPFSRDILPLETYIVGTSYLPDPHALAERLTLGATLTMKREPNNPHDENTILLLTEQGEKAGYIRRTHNDIIARLMDAGKSCFARIDDFYALTTSIFRMNGFALTSKSS